MKDVVVDRFNYWEKKVAIFLKNSFWDHRLYEKNLQKIAEHNNLDIYLFSIGNDELFWKRTFYMWPNDFEELYSTWKYKPYYDYITEIIKKEHIKLCLFCGNVIPWHNDFLKELKKYTIVASYIGDDDVRMVAERISKPYVKYYDWSFCGSIYYDENTKLKDKYKERWAKKYCIYTFVIMLW